MGNAAVTIHHPTSLDHGIPYLESGKIIDSTTSMIRMEKKDGAAVGCGGCVQFKKTVKSSHWTYRITKTTSSGLEVGTTISTDAEDEKEAKNKLEVKFSLTSEDMRECVVFVESHITDENVYSELYVYVDYQGKNNGTIKWNNDKNDLKLKFNYRWNPDSEMVVDITF